MKINFTLNKVGTGKNKNVLHDLYKVIVKKIPAGDPNTNTANCKDNDSSFEITEKKEVDTNIYFFFVSL